LRAQPRAAEYERVIPTTRWAKTIDGAYIAYQDFGEGPLTLVVVHGWLSHLEVYWEAPPFASMMTKLASFARVIHFDKRGTGLSDRIEHLPDLETRMDDIRAVMDAESVDRAALFGWSDGAALAALFAATYPERTVALALYGGVRMARASDYPWGETKEELRAQEDLIQEIWGDERRAREWWQIATASPPRPEDENLLAWGAKFARYAGTPGSAVAYNRMWYETDVRNVLPAIQVPTAILYRQGVEASAGGPPEAEQAAYISQRIPGAKTVQLSGDQWIPWLGDVEELGGAIDSFLGSVRQEESEFHRVLATVLFTDIVDSTAQSAALGDHRWRELRESHDRIVRTCLARYRGQEVKTMGDGFLATFDGPARAVRCAMWIADGVRSLGIEVRAGLHTGEVELDGEDVAGIAVAIGARVGAKAGPGEVLVSQTVKDLVAGSGLHFDDKGAHALKGVPGKWRLFAVTAPEP
jgi:class 3 adenylate cyclase